MKHLAIIADGNRRWARRNGLPASSGHAQGLVAIERCCDWVIDHGVRELTVYCFSTENWGRDPCEVDRIMDLARWYFGEKRGWYSARGIRVCFAGRRDRLAADIVGRMEQMEAATRGGTALTLRICVDYGGRDALVRAVAAGARTEEEINAALSAEIPAPDAILRTGGDMRLSNFLLWQAAYAELFFTPTLFPALEGAELDGIAAQFSGRKRNFGK